MPDDDVDDVDGDIDEDDDEEEEEDDDEGWSEVVGAKKNDVYRWLWWKAKTLFYFLKNNEKLDNVFACSVIWLALRDSHDG